MGKPKLKVVADWGYFSGPQIRTCDLNRISAYVPKSLTSASMQKGLFTKADFVYESRNDLYRCPAGERTVHRFNAVGNDMTLRVYWPSACRLCPPKDRCSPSNYRRIRRWEHENILEAMQRRLDRKPDAMTIRRSTVERVFRTLKHCSVSWTYQTRSTCPMPWRSAAKNGVSTRSRPACDVRLRGKAPERLRSRLSTRDRAAYSWQRRKRAYDRRGCAVKRPSADLCVPGAARPVRVVLPFST